LETSRNTLRILTLDIPSTRIRLQALLLCLLVKSPGFIPLQWRNVHGRGWIREPTGPQCQRRTRAYGFFRSAAVARNPRRRAGENSAATVSRYAFALDYGL